MAALFPQQDTFVRGEISPRLHARASLDLYRAGLSKCENFITLPHGGIRKRGGTYFAGEVKDSSKLTRLIPFVFSADQAYAVELGDLYLRLYAYGSRVGTVEVVTPWPEAVLPELQIYQSADVMWIAHEDYALRTLTRNGPESWVLDLFSFEDGPFSAVNSNDANRVYVSAISGAITVTADAASFSESDVGRLIRVDMGSYTAIPPWEAGGVLAPAGDAIDGRRVRYDGNVYEVDNSGSTAPETNGWRYGGTPPTHTIGIQPDGPVTYDALQDAIAGVYWRYLHSGFGVALITGYSSPTVVTATVLSRFPDEVVGSGNKSEFWRMGAFGPVGYAGSVTVFEERLTISKRFSVYGSKTGDFNSFQIGEKDDDALEFLQAGGGQANDIIWIADADGAMVIGTTGGIRSLSGSGLDEALTPSSFKNRKSRAFGCARVQPVDAGTSFIYVTRSRKSLAELVRDSTGRFTADDLTQVSEHIPKRGVVTIAYQNDPDPILWFPLDSGELGGFTHQPSQEVRGMHRHLLGGSVSGGSWGRVESAVVTPGQNGIDDVWLIVRRTIGGVTKRYIEVMQEPFEYRAIETAFQVDCGLSYTGAATGTVSGLTHLNGQTVDVLADGKVFKGLTVASGSVTLPDGATAAQWHVGLGYQSSAVSLELDVGSRDGSLMGRRKKLSAVILSLFETDTTNLEISALIRGRWEKVKLPSVVVPDGKANLYTGNVKVDIDDSWEGMGQFQIRHSGPTPCTIRSATPCFDAEP